MYHPGSSDGLLALCLCLSVCFCVLAIMTQCLNAKSQPQWNVWSIADLAACASLGWFRHWRILVVLSVKCSRNRSAMTSSEQWCSGSVSGSLRPIRAFATLYMDFMFHVYSSILSQKYADFVVISSRLYVSRNEVNMSLCTVSRVCRHRRSARRSWRFASDRSSLNQGVLWRIVMTRVMSGACLSINPVIVELYWRDRPVIWSLGLLNSVDCSRSVINSILFMLYWRDRPVIVK